MKRLFAVFHNYESDLQFREAKEICNRMGGQYMSGSNATRVVPRLPPGFIFRSEEAAKAFELQVESSQKAKVTK